MKQKIVFVLFLFGTTLFAQDWNRSAVRDRWGEISSYSYIQRVTCTGMGSGSVRRWELIISYMLEQPNVIFFSIRSLNTLEVVPAYAFINEEVKILLREGNHTDEYYGIFESSTSSLNMMMLYCRDSGLVNALCQNKNFTILIEGRDGSWYVRANIKGNMPTGEISIESNNNEPFEDIVFSEKENMDTEKDQAPLGIPAHIAQDKKSIPEQGKQQKNKKINVFTNKIQWSGIIPKYNFELGYIYEPNHPIGFRIGTHGFYTTWNFNLPNWQGYKHSTTKGNLYLDSEFKDSGDRTKSNIEYVFGFSINIIDNFLMMPIGLGGLISNNYYLFSPTVNWRDPHWYIGDNESLFLLEFGLALNPIKWVSLISTYRLVDFNKSSFSIGTTIIIPK